MVRLDRTAYSIHVFDVDLLDKKYFVLENQDKEWNDIEIKWFHFQKTFNSRRIVGREPEKNHVFAFVTGGYLIELRNLAVANRTSRIPESNQNDFAL